MARKDAMLKSVLLPLSFEERVMFLARYAKAWAATHERAVKGAGVKYWRKSKKPLRMDYKAGYNPKKETIGWASNESRRS